MSGTRDVDVVVIGGGIGGSALATALARAGLAVEVLERETAFVDRVRGEWMAPWGVRETRILGIYDDLMAAGGHHVTRSVNYDELLPPALAEQTALAIAELVPGIPGALCMEHVVMQNTLIGCAAAAGARVRRGVNAVRVSGGIAPRVDFTHDGQSHALRCRLIVGADGRSSTVRRQLGLALEEGPIDHLISGLLVDRADGWPADVQSVGKAGSVMFLIFPQGGGKIRLYVDYALADRGRYSGDAGAARLLAAFAADCLPRGAAIAGARPIGPCKAFPSQDAHLDLPCADGALLIGDAAGYTDPIWGQGLSVTLRDVRMVRDLLLGSDDWRAGTFRPYAEERRERCRRIRCETRFGTTLFARFEAPALAARERAFARISANPDLAALVLAAYVGPDALPAEVFTDAYFDGIFAA